MSYVSEIGGSQEIQGRRSGYSCSYWLSFSRSGHTWCENSEYRFLLWFFLQQNCNCKQFLLYSLRSKLFVFGRAKNRSSFFTPKPHGNAYRAGYLLCYELLYQPPQPYRFCMYVQWNFKPWISILCTHVASPSVNQRFVVKCESEAHVRGSCLFTQPADTETPAFSRSPF